MSQQRVVLQPQIKTQASVLFYVFFVVLLQSGSDSKMLRFFFYLMQSNSALHCGFHIPGFHDADTKSALAGGATRSAGALLSLTFAAALYLLKF